MEKIRNFLHNLAWRQNRTAVVGATLVLVVIIGVAAFYSVNKSSAVNAIDGASPDARVSKSGPIVAVVGEDDFSVIGNTVSNGSWPGQIISSGNLQIQPEREGTITEWSVRVGEQVRVGQVLGKLSRPPQTPDVVMALSEKYGELLEARTDVVALRAYTTKRLSQLKELRKDTKKSNKEKRDLLELKTPVNNEDVLSSIAAEKENARVILYESLIKTFAIAYSQVNIPTSPELIFDIALKPTIGSQDSDLREGFPALIFDVLSDLDDINTIPEKSGMAYFDNGIKLANASTPDGTVLTAANISKFKMDLILNQQYFVEVLGKIKVMELEIADIGRTSIDTAAEIDAMSAELKKELAMAEGRVAAEEAAYTTMRTASLGNYSIVAPKSGIVSSIMKRPGEFVGPGIPIAVVTAAGNEDMLVRMRIPNNVLKPKVGELLSVTRPGFKTDIQQVKLVGVGISLDDTGSYMADAVFTKATPWAIGASVRVLAPTNQAVFIKSSSYFLDEEGMPAVWAVSEADRIFAKKLTLGRTLGNSLEVYTGLVNGDRYITNPTPDIRENMFLGDLQVVSPKEDDSASDESDGHANMEGM